MYLGPVAMAQQVLGSSPQTSYPWKQNRGGGGGGTHPLQTSLQSLIPGSRYRFTSQDVTGKVIFVLLVCKYFMY